MPTKKQTNTDGQPKFSIEALRENCNTLFDCSTATFDGAVHSLVGEYSIEEMKNIIKDFKGGLI